MRRFIFRGAIAVVWLVCSSLAQHGTLRYRYFHDDYFRADGDSDDNKSCIDRGIEDFPHGLFTHEQRLHGAIILHFLLALYCFLLLAYICNDYFLPSVECICVDLNLSQDIAGATFMAMATSTPELFVNIIGTFITESDLGVGAVVGSAVFNTFGVAAASGLATLEAIELDWWPLTRDCSIYVVVLVTLTVLIWDGSVYWEESTVMIALFFLYFFVMYFNGPMMRFTKHLVSKCKGKSHDLSSETTSETQETIDEKYRPYAGSQNRSRVASSVHKKDSIDAEQQLENLPAPTSPFEIPEGGIGAKAWWILVWPIIFLLTCTIPNCRNKKLRRLYPLTFAMCVVWLGAVSYILSWMITIIGDTFDIPDSVSGLTLLAIGGCLPETISSVIMVRQGEGSMGISNSLGANTLDILMCLGFPWIVKSIITNDAVTIVSSALNYTCLALLGLVVIYFVIMILFKFTLTRALGATYACLYIVYITFAVLVELNVFVEVNPLPCDRN